MLEISPLPRESKDKRWTIDIWKSGIIKISPQRLKWTIIKIVRSQISRIHFRWQFIWNFSKTMIKFFKFFKKVVSKTTTIFFSFFFFFFSILRSFRLTVLLLLNNSNYRSSCTIHDSRECETIEITVLIALARKKGGKKKYDQIFVLPIARREREISVEKKEPSRLIS